MSVNEFSDLGTLKEPGYILIRFFELFHPNCIVSPKFYSFSQEFVKNGIKNLNANYGGQNIKVTRVVAIYGTGDPWHVLGLRPSSNPQAPVFYISGNFVFFVDFGGLSSYFRISSWKGCLSNKPKL